MSRKSVHSYKSGTKYFAEAERKSLEGIMAKRASSKYLSGARTDNWLKIKTSKRQEVVIAGFTAPRRTRPFFGALILAVREKNLMAVYWPRRYGLQSPNS